MIYCMYMYIFKSFSLRFLKSFSSFVSRSTVSYIKENIHFFKCQGYCFTILSKLNVGFIFEMDIQ